MSRLSTIIVLLSLTAVSFSASSKRGLCYVDSLENTADSTIWFKEPTSLTWYYNYGSDPTPAIDSALEFVPMLWGPPASNYNFTADIIALLRDNKVPVKYVLGFNEPDLPKNVGGSDITPVLAAELWKDWIEPLAKEGLKLGAPGVSSALDGKKWLKEFLDECKNCTSMLRVSMDGIFPSADDGGFSRFYPFALVWKLFGLFELYWRDEGHVSG